MSKWIDKFNSHALIGVWANLISLIQDEEFVDAATEDNVEEIARLRKVIFYLDCIFKNIDPELTPFNVLVNIQNSTQNCINEINAFKGNKNIGHLTNANNHADTLLTQFQQMPASLYAVSKESITESVSAYSETIGAYISKYKEETEQSVDDLVSHIDKLDEEIEEKKVKLSELDAQIDTVEQTIQKQTTELNTQYQSSEKSRAEKFEKEVLSYTQRSEENISEYSEKSDEEFKALSLKAAKIIEVLTTFQDNASEVYGVTINTLQAGAYSSYANDEKKSANRYRIYASVLMLLGVCFLVVPEIMLMFKNQSYMFDLMKIVGRIPLSLVVFVPAFYFARESGKHRTNEITNRRRQHILTTLEPYVELMKNDSAEELRIHVAKIVFSEGNVSSDSKGDETGNILSQLANLAKQIKGS